MKERFDLGRAPGKRSGLFTLMNHSLSTDISVSSCSSFDARRRSTRATVYLDRVPDSSLSQCPKGLHRPERFSEIEKPADSRNAVHLGGVECFSPLSPRGDES